MFRDSAAIMPWGDTKSVRGLKPHTSFKMTGYCESDDNEDEVKEDEAGVEGTTAEAAEASPKGAVDGTTDVQMA